VDDEYLERLRAFQATLPRPTATTRPAAAPTVPALSGDEQEMAARLAAVDSGLATSYQQVLVDVAQERDTYMGPAAEIREVLRRTITQLAPDDDVTAQTWYKGHDGKPTQAERIRYALQLNRVSDDEQVLKTFEMIDPMIGQIGRSLYGRSSKAFKAGTQRREVKKIVGWIEMVLEEVLPL
jgi:CTP:molybdopterin cytidylyltransferase MocA